MAERQTVQWTVLPNGIKRDRLRASILISPRLDSDDSGPVSLERFPDFVRWLETLREIRISLSFDPSGPANLERTRPLELRGIQHPWHEIFPASRVVIHRRTPPIGSSELTTFSARGVLEIARSAYSGIAEATDARKHQAGPRSHLFAEVLSGMADTGRKGTIYDRIEARIKQIANARLGNAGPGQAVSDLFTPDSGFSVQEWHLGLALFYHNSLLAPTPVPARRAADPIEFHDQVSRMSGFPQIMRAIGLVIDVECAGTATLNARRVRANIAWPGTSALRQPDICPWTVLDAATFTAQPKNDESWIRRGYLDIHREENGQPCFFLAQIDPLQEALKLEKAALAYATNPGEFPPFSTPRGCGVALMQNYRAAAFTQKMDDALSNIAKTTGSQEVDLFADDLVRGYRVDVLPERGGWFSLCRRTATYEFLRLGTIVELNDEGWVSTSVPRVANQNRVALTEELFRWDGWSLVAPRPGRGVSSNTPSTNRADRAASSPLTVRLHAQAESLPALRFGRAYRFRVRLADAAGNGAELENAVGSDQRYVTSTFSFERFDSVPAPDIVPREPPNANLGESPYVVVIRSNYDQPCKTRSERHVAPPRASELLAEMHGVFDSRGRPDPNAYETIKSHDSEAGLSHSSAHYSPPYLPDPLARKLLLVGVPGSTTTLTVPFGSDYPSVKPWRIVVVAPKEEMVNPDDAAPQFQETEVHSADGEVVVFLPKGETAIVMLSSLFDIKDLECMGMWQWIRQSFPQDQNLFYQEIAEGRHWMFTPQRPLTLIHAVRQPLFAPKFIPDNAANGVPGPQIVVARQPDSTWAGWTARMELPGRTASRVSIDGTWTDIVDDVTTPSRVTVHCGTHAFDQALNAQNQTISLSGRHEFGDTRHRQVEYTATAITRFKDYFPASEMPTPESVSRTSIPVVVNVPNTAVPHPPAVRYVAPVFGWDARSVNQNQVSKQRLGAALRVRLERPWYQTGVGELLGVVLPSDPLPLKLDDNRYSRWGRDPFATTPLPSHNLTPADFRGPVSAPLRVTLPGSNLPAIVVGFPVEYDEVANTWYADVTLNPQAAYFPFVRLSVVRFQPNSLQDRFVSAPILTDFGQLTPDRTISAVVDTDMPTHVTLIRFTGTSLNPANRVTATVQRRVGSGDDLIWQEGSPPVALEWTVDTEGMFATQELNTPIGTGALRILIEEYEPVTMDGPNDDAMHPIASERLVYAGTLEL